MKGSRDNRVILLVEDSPDDRYATERGLRKAGLANTLVHCATGEEAIAFLEHVGKYADNHPGDPCIVLLDLNLPGIDGHEVLRHIRSHEKHRTLPVIVLTTSADERDVAKAYSVGANSYVQKPVGFDSFMQAIQRMKEFWFELVLLPREVK